MSYRPPPSGRWAALLQKGPYFWQHRYYISHLVFTIHVQCFLFAFFMLLMVLDWLHALPSWLTTLLPFVPIAYFVMALRTFYQQSWLKMVLKSLMLGTAYSLAMTFCLVVVAVLGALVF